MKKYVLVVESPTKSKTIKKFLGENYQVLPSYGHVMDLPNRFGSVEPDNNFYMHYKTIKKNKKHITNIIKAIQYVNGIFLATDPDREGEVISWHIQKILEKKRLLKNKLIKRIIFYEITQKAILQALNNPRDISLNLINAQRARRALDYLVGFYLSPLLWKKIHKKLSAGRVQSPALRLIIEREEEIKKFIPKKYWNILAKLIYKNFLFFAYLVKNNKKSISDIQELNDIKKNLKNNIFNKLWVSKIEKQKKIQKPHPPFTTSSLQQESYKRFKFNLQKTMKIIQKLYEGITIDNKENIGLITYIRTDSVNLSLSFIKEIRNYIRSKYNKDFLPNIPHVYKSNVKNIQEAHEAIRPTNIFLDPIKIKKYLTNEQYKLYDLIWKRTIACQMIPAIIKKNFVYFSPYKNSEKYYFYAISSNIENIGYLSIYSKNTTMISKYKKNNIFFKMSIGTEIKLDSLIEEEHFTKPLPKYNESSLLRTMEKIGIGRPSTYVSIITTLQERNYAIIKNRVFYSTKIGRIVNSFLKKYFTKYIDYDFTSHLENKLDEVSRGEKEWIPLLEEFWKPFYDKINHIGKNVKKIEILKEIKDEKCPECNNNLLIRFGKMGEFIGCEKYPKCFYTRDLNETNQILKDRICPMCKSVLKIKRGRYNKFIGCSKFPICKYKESLNKSKDTGIKCPKCSLKNIVEKKSYKKKFFVCSGYPTCRYIIFNPPISKKCPKCNWSILVIQNKKNSELYVCPRKECNYIITASETKN